MATNVYEGLFILDANRYAQDPSGTSKIVEDIVTTAGGKLLASRLWEERKLAYEIRANGTTHRKGAYWLTYFEVDGVNNGQIEEEVKRNDAILRCMVIKEDERLVEALVSHALTGEVVAKPAEKEKVTAGGGDDSDDDVSMDDISSDDVSSDDN